MNDSTNSTDTFFSLIFQVPFLAFWRLGRSADWWPLTHLQRKTCLPSFYRSIRVLGCTTRKSVRKVSRSKKIFLQQKMILKKNWDFFLFSQFSRFLCESWNFREFSKNIYFFFSNYPRFSGFWIRISIFFRIRKIVRRFHLFLDFNSNFFRDSLKVEFFDISFYPNFWDFKSRISLFSRLHFFSNFQFYSVWIRRFSELSGL